MSWDESIVQPMLSARGRKGSDLGPHQNDALLYKVSRECVNIIPLIERRQKETRNKITLAKVAVTMTGISRLSSEPIKPRLTPF